MEQSVTVTLDRKHYEILLSMSEAWNRKPEDILKFVCEKALDTAKEKLRE